MCTQATNALRQGLNLIPRATEWGLTHAPKFVQRNMNLLLGGLAGSSALSAFRFQDWKSIPAAFVFISSLYVSYKAYTLGAKIREIHQADASAQTEPRRENELPPLTEGTYASHVEALANLDLDKDVKTALRKYQELKKAFPNFSTAFKADHFELNGQVLAVGKILEKHPVVVAALAAKKASQTAEKAKTVANVSLPKADARPKKPTASQETAKRESSSVTAAPKRPAKTEASKAVSASLTSVQNTLQMQVNAFFQKLVDTLDTTSWKKPFPQQEKDVEGLKSEINALKALVSSASPNLLIIADKASVDLAALKEVVDTRPNLIVDRINMRIFAVELNNMAFLACRLAKEIREKRITYQDAVSQFTNLFNFRLLIRAGDKYVPFQERYQEAMSFSRKELQAYRNAHPEIAGSDPKLGTDDEDKPCIIM